MHFRILRATEMASSRRAAVVCAALRLTPARCTAVRASFSTRGPGLSGVSVRPADRPADAAGGHGRAGGGVGAGAGAGGAGAAAGAPGAAGPGAGGAAADDEGVDAARDANCTVTVKNLPFTTTDESFAAHVAAAAPGAVSAAVMTTSAGASLGKGCAVRRSVCATIAASLYVLARKASFVRVSRACGDCCCCFESIAVCWAHAVRARGACARCGCALARNSGGVRRASWSCE